MTDSIFAGMTTKGHKGNVCRDIDSRVTIHESPFTEKGFTLLEVLIAFAIVSLVMAALYSTFFLSGKAVDAVDDSLVRMQECRAVIDVMRREIESSLYDSTRTSNGKAYTIFKIIDKNFYGKQASQLVFTTFSPLLPGLAKITYTVEEKDGRLSLKKKISSAYAKTDETEGTELIEDLESFTVEAKFSDKWVKTWDGALQGEVRITVRVPVKNRKASGAELSPSDVFTLADVAMPRTGKSL